MDWINIEKEGVPMLNGHYWIFQNGSVKLSHFHNGNWIVWCNDNRAQAYLNVTHYANLIFPDRPSND